MATVIGRLLSLEPAADANNKPEPFPLDLAPEAHEVFVDNYNRHRVEIAEFNANHDDDLAAAWTKLEAYFARFALFIQLCKWASGDAAAGNKIDVDSIHAAIELQQWFGHEAKRVYGMFCESAEDREQRELADLIRRNGGRTTARELARSCRRYRQRGESEAALDQLVKEGHGNWLVEPTNGRPRRVFVIHTDDTGDGDVSAANAEENGLPLPSPGRNGQPRGPQP